ncbi:RNA-directed DNA polymerase, eukaryota, reverse transcriptase zinc-binding domain protein [Tanacetum coccineum]
MPTWLRIFLPPIKLIGVYIGLSHKNWEDEGTVLVMGVILGGRECEECRVSEGLACLIVERGGYGHTPAIVDGKLMVESRHRIFRRDEHHGGSVRDTEISLGYGRGVSDCLNSSKGSILVKWGAYGGIPNSTKTLTELRVRLLELGCIVLNTPIPIIRVIKAIHGPEGGLITDVRRGFRSTWTSIVSGSEEMLQNQGVLIDVFPRLYTFGGGHQNRCLVLKTPFLYLGSFVGGAMHRLQAWNDIVDRVRRRLSKWKMKMLSIGGRLTLVKSVLGSMPIFHMSMFKVPSGILRTLESIRCQFFNGHDVSSKKASWVQWNKVLAPKDKGGLGVSSLYALNRGLMFKWVWRFLTQDTSLWARVIKAIHGGDGNIGAGTRSGTKSCWMNIVNEINVLSKKDINLMNFLRIKLGNGESTLFWEDVWCEGGKLKDRFPRAYALESCKTITVGSKLVQPNLTYSFRRTPRGGAEQTQTDELAALMQPVTLSPISDRWTWTLNSSGEFSVASVRNLIDVKMFPEGDHKTRWIRYVPIKVNTHAWKVMTNSLPTRFNISRRGIDIDSITCANCDMGVETTSHLFFTCDMAQQVARLITRWWDVPDLEMDSYGSWKIWMVNLRMPSKNKKMLVGVFYVMWWLLWAFRNKKIFEDKAPSKAIMPRDDPIIERIPRRSLKKKNITPSKNELPHTVACCIRRNIVADSTLALQEGQEMAGISIPREERFNL